MNRDIYFKLELLINKMLYEKDLIPYDWYINAENIILKEIGK